MKKVGFFLGCVLSGKVFDFSELLSPHRDKTTDNVDKKLLVNDILRYYFELCTAFTQSEVTSDLVNLNANTHELWPCSRQSCGRMEQRSLGGHCLCEGGERLVTVIALRSDALCG